MKKFEEGTMFTEVALLRVAGKDQQHDHLGHLGRGASPANNTLLSQRQSAFPEGRKKAVSIK